MTGSSSRSLGARVGARVGACVAGGALLLASCATAGRPSASREEPPLAAYPSARFVVISDPHVYDPPAYEPSAAQAERAARERPPMGRGLALFREAVSRAIELKADFVLVPGDLTRDGELSSHEAVARELGRLAEAGVRAFVTPGNHDVEKPRARSYRDGAAVSLPSASRADFGRIYDAFGYGGALSRDRDSLSYVARLVPGLRLLALDPFRRPSRPDPQSPEPASELGGETMAWLRSQLETARREGERVIVACHLSILEHFEGQAEYFPTSLPRGRVELAGLLADSGVELAFTGHFHMQDVRRIDYRGKWALCDIATASLVDYPMAYRLAEIEGGGRGPEAPSRAAVARVRSYRLPEAGADGASGGSPARAELEERRRLFLERRLTRVLAPEDEARGLASAFARAYVALVAGDERPGPGDDAVPEAESLVGALAAKKYGPLLASLWRDLPPEDNDLEIDLRE